MTDAERDSKLEEIISRLEHVEHLLENVITSMLDAMLTSHRGTTDLQKLINEARRPKN
jgi:exonuclease VII small subunit